MCQRLAVGWHHHVPRDRLAHDHGVRAPAPSAVNSRWWIHQCRGRSCSKWTPSRPKTYRRDYLAIRQARGAQKLRGRRGTIPGHTRSLRVVGREETRRRRTDGVSWTHGIETVRGERDEGQGMCRSFQVSPCNTRNVWRPGANH